MRKNIKQANWALGIGAAFIAIGLITGVHWGWYASCAGLVFYGIYYKWL